MLWLPANGEWAFLVISLCLLANVPLYTNVPVSCCIDTDTSLGWISNQRYSLSMDGKGNVYQILTLSKTQRKRQDQRVNGVLTISFKVCVLCWLRSMAASLRQHIQARQSWRMEKVGKTGRRVNTHGSLQTEYSTFTFSLPFWVSLLWPNKPFVSSFICPPRARRWSVQCSTLGHLFLPTATFWYQRTVTSLWGWQAATSTCSSGRALGNTLWSTWMFVPRYQTRFLFSGACVDVLTFFFAFLRNCFFDLFFWPFSFLSLCHNVKEGRVVRISFSNMFKEFKLTPTWLQFPFQCGDADGSMSVAKSGRRGKKKTTKQTKNLCQWVVVDWYCFFNGQ